MKLRNAYKDKRVCVTGGAGFVGFQLVSQLVRAGAEVTVIDNFSRGHNRVSGVEYINSDAGDVNACKYAFCGGNASARRKPVDYVFNLAAEVAGVFHNAQHNVEMFHLNSRLQTAPLLAASEEGVPNFLQVSSVCVYSPEHQEYAIERYGMDGQPHFANYGYAWAKRAGELMAGVSNVERIVKVRPTNMYGPYDYFGPKSHVIPALIRKALTQPYIELLGNPANVREFLHSKDGARGMMYAAAFGEDGEVYNIHAGADNQLTMIGLAKLIRSIAGFGPEDKPIKFSDEFGSGGDPIRQIDGGKISDLGYEPQIHVGQGIKEVIEWVKKTDALNNENYQ
jgi:GDP-L-fucose synthase